MINRIIFWSIKHRLVVLLAAAILIGVGGMSVRQTPVDAIPDLSEVQVIIKTSFPGQAPQVVEDQVTYPLTTACCQYRAPALCVVSPSSVIPTSM